MRDAAIEAHSEESGASEGHAAVPAEGGTPLGDDHEGIIEALAKALEPERPEISAYVLSHLPVEKIYETLNMIRRQAADRRTASLHQGRSHGHRNLKRKS